MAKYAIVAVVRKMMPIWWKSRVPRALVNVQPTIARSHRAMMAVTAHSQSRSTGGEVARGIGRVIVERKASHRVSYKS